MDRIGVILANNIDRLCIANHLDKLPMTKAKLEQLNKDRRHSNEQKK